MDAEQSVAARTGVGGAAPTSVRAMLAECRARFAAASRWREEAAARLRAAAADLDARAHQLAALPDGRRAAAFDARR
jgi:hypothetical protein